LEVRHCQCEQESFVGGVEEKSLISGVTEFNIKYEDSIVSPTLSPYTSVDLGASSLVSGVDCNHPDKKSPIR
jgi:hypothetical protein